MSIRQAFSHALSLSCPSDTPLPGIFCAQKTEQKGQVARILFLPTSPRCKLVFFITLRMPFLVPSLRPMFTKVPTSCTAGHRRKQRRGRIASGKHAIQGASTSGFRGRLGALQEAAPTSCRTPRETLLALGLVKYGMRFFHETHSTTSSITIFARLWKLTRGTSSMQR